jgi:hypothetical protein
MAQHQVLRARWSANRIGLHKAQFVEGAFQRSGCEEAPGDGEAPQVVEFNQHDQILPKVRGVITRRPWFISRCCGAREKVRRFVPVRNLVDFPDRFENDRIDLVMLDF